MRNVTIVESNVEPNKEHLWFYNGKLKWFGPNGWEDICVCKSPSPSSTTTTTPKPVVPPATTTTTTSTAPGPGVATTPIGMRVYNYMDAIIDTIVFGANSVNRPIPANGDVYIEGVYPSSSGGNITLYIKARGSGSTSSGIQVNRFLDVNIMGEISGTSIEQYKSILNEGTIDIPYTGSDALHSISLVVSISDGDATTTTTTPPPPKKIGLSNQVYPNTTLGVVITANNLNNISPSELQSIRSGSYIDIDDYPTLTRKYLAVVRPKDSNYSKEAIVAEIVLVGADYGDGQYSLYPIETREDDSSKSFLFDLSKKPVDTPYIEQVNLYSYNSITMSTIPPFIDGSIPPLADEE